MIETMFHIQRKMKDFVESCSRIKRKTNNEDIKYLYILVFFRPNICFL